MAAPKYTDNQRRIARDAAYQAAIKMLMPKTAEDVRPYTDAVADAVFSILEDSASWPEEQ